ncbi:MAG: transglutaminase, partial [Zymomonas sp.]
MREAITNLGDIANLLKSRGKFAWQRQSAGASVLLTVLRQANGAGHAVLTVTTDKGDLVLDNLEEEIRDW